MACIKFYNYHIYSHNLMPYLYTRHFSKQLYILLVPKPFNHKNLSVTSVNRVNPLVLELSPWSTVENSRDLNN
jgi:hypothetical protein